MSKYRHYISGIHTLLYWFVAPCSLVRDYHHLGGACWLYVYLHCVSTFPWDDDDHLQYYTVS